MTRRAASGESSISKGADGRFHGWVSMGKKENGARDRRHVVAVKRTDVVRMVRVLEDQRDTGNVIASGRGVTVEQWMTVWLETIAARKVRPSTLAGNRTCLRVTLHRGHDRLDRLQPEHLEAFYTRLQSDGSPPPPPCSTTG